MLHRNIWKEILGWTVLAVTLLLVIPVLYPTKLPWVYHAYHVILFFILFTVYYLNIHLIIPKLIKRNINFYYILSFFGVCAFVIGIMNLIEIQLDVRALVYQSIYPDTLYRPEENKSYINYYLFFLTVIVFSVGYMNHLFNSWREEEQKNNRLKEQKVKAELESLKAQMHRIRPTNYI